jgi:hypothetical protein
VLTLVAVVCLGCTSDAGVPRVNAPPTSDSSTPPTERAPSAFAPPTSDSSTPPTERAPSAFAPPIDLEKVQPLWDPNHVESLPWETRVGVPRDLDPRAGSLGSAASTAIAAADAAGRLWLLSPEQTWWHEAFPEGAGYLDARAMALADDGSRIAVSGRTGLWWRDISASGWTKVPYPRGLAPADYYVSVEFGPTDALILATYEKMWAVSLPTGRAERLPFNRFDDVSALSDGDLVVTRFADNPVRRSIERYRGGELIQSSDPTSLESLQRPAANATSIVATRGDSGRTGPRTSTDHDGLLALRLDGLTTCAFLPFDERHGYYSDSGRMTALGWLGDDTVLAIVQPRDDADTSWLFTWGVESGELRRVGSFPTDITLAVAIGSL